MTLEDRDRRYVPYDDHRNFACRLTEYVYRGLKCVTMENRFLRVSIAADKGADVYELLHKPTDTELLFRAPLGLRAQSPTSPSIHLREGSFLDFYEGGWQELFPYAGDSAGEYKGAQIGMHGEVALQPWSYRIIQDAPDKVSVAFCVRALRTPFLLERTMTIESDRGALIIEEKLTNRGDETMGFMWGHHPAFGWPFLEEGCKISLPPCSVLIPDNALLPNTRLVSQEGTWPAVVGANGKTVDLSTMPGPDARNHDFAFLHGFREGWYEIRNPRSGLRFSLSWDPRIFPYLWYWQVTRGAFGYPWYGKTYSLALEPHSTYPQPSLQGVELQMPHQLQSDGEITTRLTAEVS